MVVVNGGIMRCELFHMFLVILYLLDIHSLDSLLDKGYDRHETSTLNPYKSLTVAR